MTTSPRPPADRPDSTNPSAADSAPGSGSTHASVQEHLDRRRAGRRRGMIVAAILAVLALVAVGIVALTQRSGGEGGAGGAAGELTALRIADTAQSDYQDAIIEVGRENGLDLEFVNFDDPYLPNTALLEGEVDANSFQHIAWLSAFNGENDSDITPLFSTNISQWGLYSSTVTDLAELPDGARIAMPDDPSNFSRALFILQSAGLLEISDEEGFYPTEEQITANPKNIEFARLAHESVQTAYEDPSVDGVVVGTDDFDPALGITVDDALQAEDPEAPSSVPYTIIVATMPDRAEDPVWEQLEETYRDQRVVDAFNEEKNGQASYVDRPRSELLDALEELDKARET
ncbi:MetQ/NlpA family ABC transporter substrate-binding protein [Brevibacterium sp. NPDC049920]|uniref:MetQ/NlpA family ABC transporter substrate-binding protein n=1 Tax=Brevibacterium sp. NPDC049920 TaxID=3155279 RepID=UPI0033F86107